MYLRDLSGHVPYVYVGVHVPYVYVGVHVCRTDYINYIQTRYKAKHSFIHASHVYVRVYVFVHLQNFFFDKRKLFIYKFIKNSE